MEATLSLQTLRHSWIAIDYADCLRRTTGPSAIDLKTYLETEHQKTLVKRARRHIRGLKGACGRWKLPFAAPSIEALLGDAAIIAKHVRESADYTLRWLANAQKRKEIARKGANARWHRKQHPVSIACACVEGDSRSPGILNNSKRDTPPTPPNAFAGPQRGSEGQYGGNPAADPGERSAPRQSSFWRVFKKSSNPQNTDPRFEAFRGEILVYWKEKNPGQEFFWMRKDRRALDELLKCFPKLEFSTFKQWLLHRAWSEVNQSELPRRWLGRLSEYAEGPLDRYGKPLVRRIY